MGGLGRRLLFNLRNKIFTKLQELPVAFFNQNKADGFITASVKERPRQVDHADGQLDFSGLK